MSWPKKVVVLALIFLGYWLLREALVTPHAQRFYREMEEGRRLHDRMLRIKERRYQ